MLAELTTVNTALTRSISKVREQRAIVRSSNDVAFLRDAKRKAKTIGQTSKTFEIAEEMRKELLWLQLDINIRLWELGELTSSWDKSTITKYRQDEKAFEQAIAEYTDCYLINSIRQRMSKEEEVKREYQDYKDKIINGAKPSKGSPFDSEQWQTLVRVELENLVNTGDPFKIADLARGISSGYKVWDFENEILHDICRKAIMESPKVEVDSVELPRFITFHIDDEWYRIPVEYATLEQIDNMVEIREDQLEQDRQALDRLQKARNAIASHVSNRKEPIGNKLSLKTEYMNGIG